jgi:predicted transglutaminase-like cysteine proteinase
MRGHRHSLGDRVYLRSRRHRADQDCFLMRNEWVQTALLVLLAIAIYVLAFVDIAYASDAHWPLRPETAVNRFVGAAQFCERYPEDCKAKDKNQKITVTDRVRLDLIKVTTEVNLGFIYEEDISHYGMDDWWEYPTVDGKGDCEDFALEKKRRLIAMGYPQSALRLALVRAAKKGEADHVVLVVFTSNTNLVLDIRDNNAHWPNQTPYKFLYVQSSTDPREWVQW